LRLENNHFDSRILAGLIAALSFFSYVGHLMSIRNMYVNDEL